tara:strand:+ start:156 stop:305 length:150 start_codon:yes stop_codon:yes gene_type:complete
MLDRILSTLFGQTYGCIQGVFLVKTMGLPLSIEGANLAAAIKSVRKMTR